MRLPKNAKPSKALARDCTRPRLTHAYVMQPNGHRELVATNAYILVRLPVGDDVPLGAVHGEALKLIERGKRHEITDEGVKVNAETTGEIVYRLPGEAHESPVDKLPEFKPGNETVTIGLNPQLLKDIADALGGKHGVRLEIPVQDGTCMSGIRVTPLMNGAVGEGLLMPMRLKL